MDKADAIASIIGRHYLQAANFIVKSILEEKIHTLGQRKRNQVTRTVAKLLRQNHARLRAFDSGLKPKEIAEQAYAETVMELESTENNDSSPSN